MKKFALITMSLLGAWSMAPADDTVVAPNPATATVNSGLA